MDESFLKYLKFEKRFSPHTIQAYTLDLDQFSNYLAENFAECSGCFGRSGWHRIRQESAAAAGRT